MRKSIGALPPPPKDANMGCFKTPSLGRSRACGRNTTRRKTLMSLFYLGEVAPVGTTIPLCARLDARSFRSFSLVCGARRPRIPCPNPSCKTFALGGLVSALLPPEVYRRFGRMPRSIQEHIIIISVICLRDTAVPRYSRCCCLMCSAKLARVNAIPRLMGRP